MAWDMFWNAVAITFGILSPVIAVFILFIFVQAFRALPAAMEIKADKLKKQPPFDDGEVNVDPSTNVMTVRLIKDGEIVWQGASSRRELMEDEKLTFRHTEATE